MKKSGLIGYLSVLGLISDKKVDMFSFNEANQILAEVERQIPISELPDICGHSGPCIPGKTRLFVDTDGKLFPCEKCSETSGSMQIGHVNSGFDFENIKKIMNIAALTEERCKNCWALSKCDICAAKIGKE